MVNKQKIYIWWLIGCLFLGAGSNILWGVNSLPFIIGLILVIATSPYILKE